MLLFNWLYKAARQSLSLNFRVNPSCTCSSSSKLHSVDTKQITFHHQHMGQDSVAVFPILLSNMNESDDGMSIALKCTQCHVLMLMCKTISLQIQSTAHRKHSKVQNFTLKKLTIASNKGVFLNLLWENGICVCVCVCLYFFIVLIQRMRKQTSLRRKGYG